MPELTVNELAALFAWIVDAQEFLPVPDQANKVIDKLIRYQKQLKEQPASLDQEIEHAQITAW